MDSLSKIGIPEEEISVDLVRRIQEGDGGAWNSLYDRYRDRLLLYIRCRLSPALRSRIQSEDILQSVFKDAVDDLQRFRPEGDQSLSRFLHTCVLNKIRKKVTYFSAQKRTGDVPLTETLLDQLPEAPNSVDAEYRDGPVFEKLERGIAALPEGMREILFLRLFEDFSNRDAASAMGKTPEAASKLFNRALTRLALYVNRPKSG